MAMAGVAMAETASTVTAEFTDLPRWAANFYSDNYTLTFTLSEDFTLTNSGTVLAAYWGTDATSTEWGANAIVLSNGSDGALTLTVGRGKMSIRMALLGRTIRLRLVQLSLFLTIQQQIKIRAQQCLQTQTSSVLLTRFP